MARPQTRARASTPRHRPAAKTAARRSVYAFGGGKADGRADMKELLGGKGANLAEMARLGMPVPPGFTITTEVCTYYYANKRTLSRRRSTTQVARRHSRSVETVVGATLRRSRAIRCSSRCARAPAPRCRA